MEAEHQYKRDTLVDKYIVYNLRERAMSCALEEGYAGEWADPSTKCGTLEVIMTRVVFLTPIFKILKFSILNETDAYI